MTELEQYKKAYATLVGRVDRTITKLEEIVFCVGAEKTVVAYIAETLKEALEEVEEIFLAEDPEEE